MNETLTAQYEFLKKIIHYGNCSNFRTDITQFRKLMGMYLPDIYTGYPAIYPALINEFEKIKEYAAYKELASKNIVALGGKFSSGKSSFFNSLYGGRILPVDTESNVIMPMYIVYGNSTSAYAINQSDYFIEMTTSEMKTVFQGIKDQDDEPPVILAHTFKSMLTYASETQLNHIAFLDTPGYVSAKDKNYTGRSSEFTTVRQMNNSNYILWFADIDIRRMCISDHDIEFLKLLNPDIPKLIIITKADIYSPKEFPEIVMKTSKILSMLNIKFIDVLAYSEKAPEKYDKFKILAYFDRWNKTPSIINFPGLFENALTKNLIKSDDFIAEFRDTLLPVVSETANRIYGIENAFQTEKKDGFVALDSVQAKKILKNLENNSERTDIPDRTSLIPMPDTERFFRKYNDKNQKDSAKYERYINAVSIMLTETMKDTNFIFSDSSQRKEYKKSITAIIAAALDADMTDPNLSSDTTIDETITDNSSNSTRGSRSMRQSRSSSVSSIADSHTEETAAPPPSTRRERRSSSRRRSR